MSPTFAQNRACYFSKASYHHREVSILKLEHNTNNLATNTNNFERILTQIILFIPLKLLNIGEKKPLCHWDPLTVKHITFGVWLFLIKVTIQKRNFLCQQFCFLCFNKGFRFFPSLVDKDLCLLVFVLFFTDLVLEALYMQCS